MTKKITLTYYPQTAHNPIPDILVMNFLDEGYMLSYVAENEQVEYYQGYDYTGIKSDKRNYSQIYPKNHAPIKYMQDIYKLKCMYLNYFKKLKTKESLTELDINDYIKYAYVISNGRIITGYFGKTA
jgi:hypothetical protein